MIIFHTINGVVNDYWGGVRGFCTSGRNKEYIYPLCAAQEYMRIWKKRKLFEQKNTGVFLVIMISVKLYEIIFALENEDKYPHIISYFLGLHLLQYCKHFPDILNNNKLKQHIHI